MKSKLSSLCSYRKGKIAVSELDSTNYISTENMLADKGGITKSSGLPASDFTQVYYKNDVLVSNIRPYFKKIWFANMNGGCSNDVLVFTANNECEPSFLYYVLSNDDFFNYATVTAKGTKMPRGDKKAIMEYEVPIYDIDTQKKIASILSVLDEKIEVNQKINENLEQQAQAIFKNLLDNLNDCDIVSLDDMAIICNKTFNPSKEKETMLEHYSIPSYDDNKFPIFELSTNIKSNKFIIDKDCFLISKLNPTTKRVWKPYCISNKSVCSTEFIVYKAKNVIFTDFLYSLIDSDIFSEFMCSHVTGSTGSRQRTTPSETLKFKFKIPKTDDLLKFNSIVSPIYKQIMNNAIQNDRLKNIRDTLLPKLINGEIDINGN